MKHVSFLDKLRMIVVEPRDFFKLALQDDIGEAIKQNILPYIIVLFLSLPYNIMFNLALNEKQTMAYSLGFTLGFIIVGIPIGIILSVFVAPLFYRLFFWMVGGTGTYEKLVVMRIYAMTYMAWIMFPATIIFTVFSAMALFNKALIIPTVIIVYAITIPIGIWFIIISIVGYSETENISKLRAFGGLCLMLLAFFLLILIFVVFILLLVGGIAKAPGF